jgi:hypothetical protein
MIPDLPQMGKNQLTEDVCAHVKYFNGLTGGGGGRGKKKNTTGKKRKLIM